MKVEIPLSTDTDTNHIHTVVRYGANTLKTWHFETWNEPDLKTYNLLNFTITGMM